MLAFALFQTLYICKKEHLKRPLISNTMIMKVTTWLIRSFMCHMSYGCMAPQESRRLDVVLTLYDQLDGLGRDEKNALTKVYTYSNFNRIFQAHMKGKHSHEVTIVVKSHTLKWKMIACFKEKHPWL